MTIAEYLSELSGLWKELGIFKQHVYDFLVRLNDIFDHIRIIVLKQDPFSSLQQAYSYVHQKESRWNIL